MRVILMHNPSAGHADHSAAELADEIRRAGHELLCDVADGDELSSCLHLPCDLVAAAGGDGTVDKASTVLWGTQIPFTVLPLGTANNVARALGLSGTTRELIAQWEHSSVRAFDAAVATMRGDETARFIEGFGFGAFPRVMRQTERVPDPNTRDQTLARDLKLLRARIADAPLERYILCADGEDLSGEYFMVEILNIPFIGPSFTLAPGASASDGKLDVVLAGEEERELLLAGVEQVMRGEEPSIELLSRQASQVVIRGGSDRHHRDGELHEERVHHVEVRIDQRALRVLVPPARSPSRRTAPPREPTARP